MSTRHRIGRHTFDAANKVFAKRRCKDEGIGPIGRAAARSLACLKTTRKTKRDTRGCYQAARTDGSENVLVQRRLFHEFRVDEEKEVREGASKIGAIHVTRGQVDGRNEDLTTECIQ